MAASTPPRSFAVQLQLAVARPLMRVLAVASWAGIFSGRLGQGLGRVSGGADSSDEMTARALRLLRSPQALNAEATVPATVISAGKRAGVPADYVTSIETSHETLAARFARGTLVVAEDASHAVPTDDPGVVVDQVQAVLAAL